MNEQTTALLVNMAGTIGVPIALWLLWLGVDALRRRGYQTAYADALLRAVGVGALAARQQGETIMSVKGRNIALRAGVEYLTSTVGTAAAKLGIDTTEDHQTRINAQIGTLVAQVDAAGPTLLKVPQATLDLLRKTPDTGQVAAALG